jgi:hypothetical protein
MARPGAYWRSRVQRGAWSSIAGGADKAALTESDWTTIKEKLAPFVAWQAARPSTALAALGDARVRELHAGTFRQDISALVVMDAAQEDQSSQIELVEKMILFRRDLVRLPVPA